jgi:hypothetical protein
LRIEPNQVICGVDAIRLRGFLDREKYGWHLRSLADGLSLSMEAAQAVADDLVREGYAEIDADERDGSRYCNTIKGNALALASAAKPIKRATANRLVEGFLARVREINASDTYVYRVAKAVVFGSYLSDREDLGDVDIAVKLVPTDADRDVHVHRRQLRISAACQQGRRFGNFLEELDWPREEVLRYLKNRSRAISIHGADDRILSMTETRTIFEE